MQRLMITNHFQEESIGMEVFGFLRLSYKRVRHLSLSIHHPNGDEELLYFATQNSCGYNGNEYKFVNLDESKYKGIRAAKIQEIVNRLEAEGYSVSTAQLALFMDVRIDRLILEKRM